MKRFLLLVSLFQTSTLLFAQHSQFSQLLAVREYNVDGSRGSELTLGSNAIRVGQWILKEDEGGYSEGKYERGRRVGIWKFFSLNNVLTATRTFASGTESGEQEHIVTSAYVRRGVVDEKRDGDFWEDLVAGTPSKTCYEIRGTPSGRCTIHGAQQDLYSLATGYLFGDVKSGTWTYEDRQGKVLYTQSYLAGLRHGESISADGTREKYFLGLKHGEWHAGANTSFYYLGKQTDELSFKASEPTLSVWSVVGPPALVHITASTPGTVAFVAKVGSVYDQSDQPPRRLEDTVVTVYPDTLKATESKAGAQYNAFASGKRYADPSLLNVKSPPPPAFGFSSFHDAVGALDSWNALSPDEQTNALSPLLPALLSANPDFATAQQQLNSRFTSFLRTEVARLAAQEYPWNRRAALQYFNRIPYCGYNPTLYDASQLNLAADYWRAVYELKEQPLEIEQYWFPSYVENPTLDFFDLARRSSEEFRGAVAAITNSQPFSASAGSVCLTNVPARSHDPLKVKSIAISFTVAMDGLSADIKPLFNSVPFFSGFLSYVANMAAERGSDPLADPDIENSITNSFSVSKSLVEEGNAPEQPWEPVQPELRPVINLGPVWYERSRPRRPGEPPLPDSYDCGNEYTCEEAEKMSIVTLYDVLQSWVNELIFNSQQLASAKSLVESVAQAKRDSSFVPIFPLEVTGAQVAQGSHVERGAELVTVARTTSNDPTFSMSIRNPLTSLFRAGAEVMVGGALSGSILTDEFARQTRLRTGNFDTAFDEVAKLNCDAQALALVEGVRPQEDQITLRVHLKESNVLCPIPKTASDILRAAVPTNVVLDPETTGYWVIDLGWIFTTHRMAVDIVPTGLSPNVLRQHIGGSQQ